MKPLPIRRAIVAVALIAVSAFALPGAAGAIANPKPTVVLVHGAWADGSSWSGVTAALQRQGYDVRVPPNPLRGLGTDTAALRDYLKTIRGPIVLAGHSYGGAVITDAATDDDQVKALVYIDAYLPDAGETILQLTGAKPGSAFSDPAKAFDLVPLSGGDTDVYIKPSVFHAAFAADLDRRAAAALAAQQRPLAASILQEPSTAPAWQTIKSYVLIGTEDKVIPPAEQVVMAARAKAHVVKVKSSHVSLISHPAAVADLIETAAGARAAR
jgi:pimeloyl-ACP methyl ester carboxylesterase